MIGFEFVDDGLDDLIWLAIFAVCLLRVFQVELEL